MKNNYTAQTQRPSPTAILNPRCDPVFKSMFTKGTKESDFALKDFISTILGRNIIDMKLVPNEEPVEILNEKQMCFDVNVTFDNGEKAELEMQGRNQNYDYASRAEIHAAKLLVSNNKRGDNYDIGKVYQISVVNFEFDKDDNSPLSWYNMRKDTGGRLGDRLNVIFLDLVKIRRLTDTPVEQLSKVEKWGMFFALADNEKYQTYVRKIIESEEAIMAADSVVRKMSKDEAEWFRQNSYENAIWDYNHGMYRAEQRGIEKGIEKGRSETKIENAKNFLRLNKLSCEEIAQCCYLPLEMVLSLKDELDKHHAPAAQ